MGYRAGFFASHGGGKDSLISEQALNSILILVQSCDVSQYANHSDDNFIILLPMFVYIIIFYIADCKRKTYFIIYVQYSNVNKVSVYSSVSDGSLVLPGQI